MAGYYALSVGHGLCNIAARLLALESRSRAILAKEEKWSGGFPAFDETHDHWLALNGSSVEALEKAADHHRGARDLVILLRALVEDERWSRHVERRNVDFHRWRPQSITGGVATSNPWISNGDHAVLTVYAGETHRPEEIGAIIAELRAALEALEETMRTWANGFVEAFDAVLVYVLAEAMGGEQLDRDRAEGAQGT